MIKSLEGMAGYCQFRNFCAVNIFAFQLSRKIYMNSMKTTVSCIEAIISETLL